METFKDFFHKKLNESKTKILLTTTCRKGQEQIEKVLQSYNIGYEPKKTDIETMYHIEVDNDLYQKLSKVSWLPTVKFN